LRDNSRSIRTSWRVSSPKSGTASTVLTPAVEQHARSYAQSFSLQLCWQDDDTAAKNDYTSFQSFLDAFGFRSPEVLELARDDTMPGWTAVQKFFQVRRDAEAAGSNGRSIVFFHYAGHGSKGANDELYLTSPSGSKSFSVELVPRFKEAAYKEDKKLRMMNISKGRVKTRRRMLRLRIAILVKTMSIPKNGTFMQMTPVGTLIARRRRCTAYGDRCEEDAF
jgi:hypothetical protein